MALLNVLILPLHLTSSIMFLKLLAHSTGHRKITAHEDALEPIVASLRQIHQSVAEVEDLMLDHTKKVSELEYVSKQHDKLNSSLTTRYEDDDDMALRKRSVVHHRVHNFCAYHFRSHPMNTAYHHARSSHCFHDHSVQPPTQFHSRTPTFGCCACVCAWVYDLLKTRVCIIRSHCKNEVEPNRFPTSALIYYLVARGARCVCHMLYGAFFCDSCNFASCFQYRPCRLDDFSTDIAEKQMAVDELERTQRRTQAARKSHESNLHTKAGVAYIPPIVARLWPSL
jgi:hypothetical protein